MWAWLRWLRPRWRGTAPPTPGSPPLPAEPALDIQELHQLQDHAAALQAKVNAITARARKGGFNA